MKNWDVTANRYVVYIDIMGFKDMVLKNSHESIYEMMKRIDEVKSQTLNVNWSGSDSEVVRSTTYSDSIMVYSRDKSLDSLKSIISSASSLSEDLFVNKIPHKGALACGLMTLDDKRSIYFGQPLIDAYLLQEELYYYGIVVHGTAEKAIKTDFNDIPFVEEYLCPLKNGAAKHLSICPMCVERTVAEANPEEYKNINNSLEEMKLMTSGHLRKYIDNTTAYFQYINSSSH